MECNPYDYCFNLRVLAWEKLNIERYRRSEVGRNTGCLANRYSDKYNCPPATICREGIDGWPAVNAPSTMDGLTTGIGVSPYATYANGKKLTAIYQLERNGTTITAPAGTKYLTNYKDLKFTINIELHKMNEMYNVGIEDIKGSTVLYYKWIVREGPQ